MYALCDVYTHNTLMHILHDMTYLHTQDPKFILVPQVVRKCIHVCTSYTHVYTE